VPEGVIVGGWSYVIGAFAVVALGLALYTVSLFQRLRSIRRRLESLGGASGGETPAQRRGEPAPAGTGPPIDSDTR
jgi:CcmD family protein